MTTASPQIETISLDRILQDARFQPRGDGAGVAQVSEAEIKRMAQAARDAGYESGWHPGIYDLIHVWPADGDRFYVLKGFHRVALARFCDLGELSAVVHYEANEAEARRLADRSNSDTRPMDPIDEAEVIKRCYDEGLTTDQVARRLDRRNPGYYERRVTLAWLCDACKRDVRVKALGVDYAEAIGAAAKQGMSAAAQQALSDMARKTKVRPALFARLVAKIVASKDAPEDDPDDWGGLFGLAEIRDNDRAAIADTLAAASEAEGIRDGWQAIYLACQTQLRRLARAKVPAPDVIARLTAEVASHVAMAEHKIAETIGDNTQGAVDDGPAMATGGREARPLLKWVGGKGRDASALIPLLADRMGSGTYIEPFLGGGAMFFALGPKRAVVNDALPDLVRLYRTVQADPQSVAMALRDLVTPGLTAEAYTAIRADYNAARTDAKDTDPVQAARLIYLNRCGFNGLHRTNSKGDFNVPWGKVKAPAMPTLADLILAGTLLGRAQICQGDWKIHVDNAEAGDLVFLDPPYPGTYQGYATAERPVDVAELARTAKSAWQRGAGVVVTLPDTEESAALFAGWCQSHPISRRTGVGADGSKRGILSQAAFASIRR